MSAHNHICGKVQQAIQAYLRARDLTPVVTRNIVRGLANTSLELPRCVITCQGAKMDPTLHSGNWRVTVHVVYVESADDTTEDDHLEHAGAAFNHLVDDELAANLSAALEDFTCFLVSFTDQGYDLQRDANGGGASWMSFLVFDLDVCGSDIV